MWASPCSICSRLALLLLWYSVSCLTVSSLSPLLYMLNIVILPQPLVICVTVMSLEGKSSWLQLLELTLALMSVTDLVFRGLLAWLDGYIVIQSLKAIVSLHPLSAGSCNATRLI